MRRRVLAPAALLVAGALVLLVAAPSGAQKGAMPPGHPPTSPGAQDNAVKPPPPGTGAGKAALTWTAPANWAQETPSSAMRRAQYKIPGKAGAGQCVVFYFGPGEGGDTKSNIERWIGQFKQPDGKPVTNAKRREFKVGDIPVTMLEVSGTYVGGMGSASGEQPDTMLLGAVADGPDGKWFFRATGPKATLEAQRGAFDKMIRSLKRGA